MSKRDHDKRAIVVTDHAILRWLERVERIDIEALREAISRAAAVGIAHRAAAVIVGGGKLILRETAVVTTLRRDGHRSDLIGKAQIEIGAEIVAGRRRRVPRRRR